MVLAEPRIAIPLRSRADKRIAERFDVSMPVQVEGRDSVTHDLSTHGMSFEAERAYAPGERIHVTVDYLLDGHQYPLRCEVVVARCEPQGDKFLVGCSLVTPLSDPDPDAPLLP